MRGSIALYCTAFGRMGGPARFAHAVGSRHPAMSSIDTHGIRIFDAMMMLSAFNSTPTFPSAMMTNDSPLTGGNPNGTPGPDWPRCCGPWRGKAGRLRCTELGALQRRRRRTSTPAVRAAKAEDQLQPLKWPCRQWPHPLERLRMLGTPACASAHGIGSAGERGQTTLGL